VRGEEWLSSTLNDRFSDLMRDRMTRNELTQAYSRGEITQEEVLAHAGANARSHHKEELFDFVEELLRQFHADSPRPAWKKALAEIQMDFSLRRSGRSSDGSGCAQDHREVGGRLGG
jgi:hypothetical protein